jgi:hypothetical protein
VKTFEADEADVMSGFADSAALMRDYLKRPSDEAGRRLYAACSTFRRLLRGAIRRHDAFCLRMTQMRDALPDRPVPGVAYAPVASMLKPFFTLAAIPMRAYSAERIAAFARDWRELAKLRRRNTPFAAWLRKHGFGVAE